MDRDGGVVRRRVAVAAVVLCVGGAGVATAVATRDDDAREPRREQAVAAASPRTAAPLEGRVLDTLGVVSYNALRHLPREKAARDWRRLLGRDGVDLVGWQESKSPVFRALEEEYADRGWSTWHYPAPEGPISLAISWRDRTMTLLDVSWRRMHRGGFPRETDAPFPARWVVTAQLRHRPTGRTVTLLNTHVNQTIETGQRFERNLNARFAKRHLRTLATMWNTVPGDVVVGTGDYNFDRRDDHRARPAGGITRAFAGQAVSTYDALGLRGVVPTRNTRWIDYVWLSSDSLHRPGGTGGAQFATHRSLGGYHSDHRPLLARIRLYD